MIEINRRAYRAHELNEKYEIKKTEKKTFLEEERISEILDSLLDQTSPH